MGKRILLAEDSLTIRKVFELTFAQSDIALTAVDNGDDAVRLAEETTPDLVVADVTLPGKDGFQVAEDLRSSVKAGTCPVLILCGTLSPFDEGRFKKSGAQGVLFKPFESRELVDKVQEILRGTEEAARKEKETEEPAPPSEEPWDFSDVLEEVEQESGKAAPAPAAKRGEELLPGAALTAQRTEGGLSLGEFDVSLDEIEGSPAEQAMPYSPEAAPEPAPEPEPAVAHIEGELFTDAPEAVTDLSRAVEAVEEFEELEDLEEVEVMQEKGPLTDEMRPSPEPVPAIPPAAGTESALREQFSARAQDIFEKVAAETVEKVLWEQMDRIALEISARIRESVEAVAWEVIPQAAEALIREEISRIREQTEKKSP
ncbi:MAG TPA: response regulator [Candidatus Deferrimicrobiaceae bacterium]